MSARFWTWPKLRAAQQMHAQGQTLEQIASHFGRRIAEIRMRLDKLARGNYDDIAWCDADRDILRATHHLGLKTVMIALESAGFPRASPGAVKNQIQEMGLALPRRVGRKPRPAGGPRNHTGHRVGEWHGSARHSDAVVRQARALHEQGLGYQRIGQKLDVPWRTVADWCRYDIRGSA